MHITTRTPCTASPELFTAGEAERADSNSSLIRIREAKKLCWTCPVQEACRNEGRRLGAEGIWGGEDDRQRRAAGYRPVAPRLPRTPAPCGTEAGAQRHRRNGQEVCTGCALAAAEAHRLRTQQREAGRPVTMPARALEVLGLLAAGCTAKEVGYRLGLHKSTVYSHRERIAAVLGCRVGGIVDAARAAGILTGAGLAAADLDVAA